MRVDVLVIVALRQFAILSVETVAAEAILARRAYAVAPPVAQRTQDAEEQSVLRIDGAALAHRHVVRWVETRRADVADRSRIALLAVNLIARAERVAIVLDEPKPMLFAKFLDRPKVERVAERVREHDGTRLGRQRLFKPRDVDVVLRDRHVDEDGHGAVLDDRRDGRREARRDRNDLITRTHGALAEERRSQRHESQQVRRRTRIDGKRVARAEECGQPLLELCSIAPRRQPKFQGTVDEGFHLLMIVDAPRVGDACPLRPGRRPVVFVGILAHKREDLVVKFLLLRFCFFHLVISSVHAEPSR